MTTSTSQNDPAKLRAKEIHHRVMVILGLFIVATGLAGAYIALGGKGDLPAWMYGCWSRQAPSVPISARRARPGLVPWRPWSAELLAQARKEDRLILLDLSNEWSRSCRLMQENAYADARVASWIASSVLAIRVDADDRPDLARRYLSGGWPTTALLLPSGEVLASATFMTADQFLSWAPTLRQAFEKKRAGVVAAVEESARARAEAFSSRGSTAALPDARSAEDNARKQMQAQWDERNECFGRGPRFPYFRLINNLARLGREDGESGWARSLARRAWKGACTLEDPAWGGFFRAQGQEEKLLSEQAEALAAAALVDPGAMRRILEYVRRFLTAPGGGYYASQSGEVHRPDGVVIEGGYYFARPAPKRSSLGMPMIDRRLFASPNAEMIAAVLETDSPASERNFALLSLERFWREGVSAGAVRRRLGGRLSGLLEDQVSLGRACLAAYEATGQPRHLTRALSVAGAAEFLLAASGSPALYDRPDLRELPPGLDRVQSPVLNARLASFYCRLTRALPGAHASRPFYLRRVEEILPWLAARSKHLEPGEWALLLQERSPLPQPGRLGGAR